MMKTLGRCLGQSTNSIILLKRSSAYKALVIGCRRPFLPRMGQSMQPRYMGGRQLSQAAQLSDTA
jgi:hypothetical protein